MTALDCLQKTSHQVKPTVPCKVGINGFGRIGRNVLRAALTRSDVQVAFINHTCTTTDDLVYLVRNDSSSIDRSMRSRVQKLSEDTITVNGKIIILTSERELKKLDWAAVGVDYVLECTGRFTTTSAAMDHITYGKAKRVIVSAPSRDAPTFVVGVNADLYTNADACRVISNASCTTNCVTPILKVLDETCGIKQALLTTIHAATRSQQVLDGYNQKSRRLGRGVFNNIIPTATGASKAVVAVLPALAGKLTGVSIRVPIPNVSLIDLTVCASQPTSLSAILDSFRMASKGQLAGILEVADEELVSSDYCGSSASAVVDAPACVELNSKFYKILAWYDDEWGYSNRLLDLVALVHDREAPV